MMRFPRPGCWYRFTSADWQFIRDSLALTQKNRESFISLLDDPEAVPPADHTYVQSRLHWLHLADELPRYLRTRSEGAREIP